MVTQAQGNGALALMLTVCSNLLGILTVPFTINLIISSAGNVDIDTIELLLKLLFTILIPLLIGKTLRELSLRVQQFAKAQKTTLSLISNGSLIFIVWQTLSRSQEDLLDQKATDILIIIVAGIAMHVVYLVWNYGATTLLQLPFREKKAVLIMASQKTLPVSVTVISFLDELKVGNHGLLTIPCIVGHMAQLFIDAVIVSRWASQAEKEERLQGGGNGSDVYTINCASSAESGDPTIGLKGPITVVSNPLAEVGPEYERESSRRRLREDDASSAGALEQTRGSDGTARRRSLQSFSVEVSSNSSGSYVSAHTVISTSTFLTAQETPQSADVSLPTSGLEVFCDAEAS